MSRAPELIAVIRLCKWEDYSSPSIFSDIDALIEGSPGNSIIKQ